MFFLERKNQRTFAPLVALVGLAGCAAPTCALPGARPMVEVQLFFGRDIAGRGTVSDAEWQAFAAADIAPRFPDGFTVLDAHGAWRDLGGTLREEASKLVEIGVPPAPDLPARIEAISAAYKTRFRQMAVGVMTREVCGRF